VKCPKCSYLGFETGDRCKNCGYDFSLLPAAEPADYEIHPSPVDDVPVHVIDDIECSDPDSSMDDDTLRISSAAEEPSAEEPSIDLGPTFVKDETPLPLFLRATGDGDDEPLIKLPVAPRPPLAVRRTPDTPRLRPVPKAPSPSPLAPVLQFSDEEVQQRSEEKVGERKETSQPSRPGARAAAVLIDHLILAGIDLAIVYFTLRMAGLTIDDWRVLPIAPMVTFLGLLKVAYFYAFTAVGGQTIGKMAVGTCVVTDAGTQVDAARAMRRTSAGILSFLLLGLGFLPALFGDHRALHDRLAGTRVVRLRSV
jgi:uncharacterized RDD family membrane protein YckC